MTSQGSGWRPKLVSSALVVLFALFSIRFGYELIRPLLPLLCLASVLGAALWLYLAWRRRQWY